jgi:hypothetical protein
MNNATPEVLFKFGHHLAVFGYLQEGLPAGSTLAMARWQAMAESDKPQDSETDNRLAKHSNQRKLLLKALWDLFDFAEN